MSEPMNSIQRISRQEELEIALAIRIAVFVTEQGVRHRQAISTGPGRDRLGKGMPEGEAARPVAGTGFLQQAWLPEFLG